MVAAIQNFSQLLEMLIDAEISPYASIPYLTFKPDQTTPPVTSCSPFQNVLRCNVNNHKVLNKGRAFEGIANNMHPIS